MEQFARAGGCIMVDSLYVKANGEMPCWDDVGEERILRRLDPDALLADREVGLLDTPALMDLRRAHLGGRLPWPGLCERCAVLGHGRARSLRPRRLEVLHVEPSYLCHLSCPQCIPAEARRSLKDPPYHMSPAFWVALLRELRREGVGRIRFIHFEGRGDPLSNPRLGEMIAAARAHYPDAMTMATTHGSFPYRPWLVECGLDVLRLSVDGATRESYARYRVGGDLDRVLALMRSVRDRRRSGDGRPRMQWKYILFEWNDSDDELRRAAQLAHELEADLCFCLTHSPGRSRRFTSPERVAEVLARLGLHASCDLTSTFQLKGSAGRERSARAAVAEHALALLRRARSACRDGREGEGRRLLKAALEWDPGVRAAALEGDPVRAHLGRILARAAPSTLAQLANIARDRGDHESAARLFERYLGWAPPDGDHARPAMIEAFLRAALERVCAGDEDGGRARLLAALRYELGPADDAGAAASGAEDLDPVRHRLPAIVARASPCTLSLLANIARKRDDHELAARLFERYLESAPADATHVRLVMIESFLLAAQRKEHPAQPAGRP